MQTLQSSFDILIADPSRAPLSLQLIKNIPSATHQIFRLCWTRLMNNSAGHDMLPEGDDDEDTFWLTVSQAHLCRLIAQSPTLLDRYSTFADALSRGKQNLSSTTGSASESSRESGSADAPDRLPLVEVARLVAISRAIMLPLSTAAPVGRGGALTSGGQTMSASCQLRMMHTMSALTMVHTADQGGERLSDKVVGSTLTRMQALALRTILDCILAEEKCQTSRRLRPSSLLQIYQRTAKLLLQLIFVSNTDLTNNQTTETGVYRTVDGLGAGASSILICSLNLCSCLERLGVRPDGNISGLAKYILSSFAAMARKFQCATRTIRVAASAAAYYVATSRIVARFPPIHDVQPGLTAPPPDLQKRERRQGFEPCTPVGRVEHEVFVLGGGRRRGGGGGGGRGEMPGMCPGGPTQEGSRKHIIYLNFFF